MTEEIINFVRNLIGNDYITTFLISIIPVVELRGAIPAAMTMGLTAGVSFALAWAGSAIVAPILLLILRPILDWMKKYKAFASFANAIESGFKSKALKVAGENNSQLTLEQAKKLERKKMLGVYLFVAFPIPLTGVWTGSAVATFLDIPFWKSMAMVWLGNLTAGAIVTVLAIFLQSYMNIVLDVFFVIVILVLFIYFIRVVVKMVKSKKERQSSQSSEVDNNSVLEDKIDTETKNLPSNTDNEEREAIDASVTTQVSQNQKEEDK